MGTTLQEILDKHDYLAALAQLVYNAQFTVTFNFDDIVDDAVYKYADDQNGVNPEIIVKPKLESRPGAPVIYHINGLLPREQIRRRSEHLILTENAFADVLMSPNSQDSEFVINQFATRTFLLLGLSLSDNSLKNMLRAGAKRNPANHHYIVYHERDGAPRSPEERRDIFQVNLNVYNLISIFLTKAELTAGIEFLNESNAEEFGEGLLELAGRKLERKYHLVGSIAAGKSSTLEALRCFATHEEWTGRPPAAMYQDDKTLTPDQQREIDAFLFKNLRLKNRRMVKAGPGIHIMDRAYLDLFAFSKDASDIEKKAHQLQSEVIDTTRTLEPGQVVFLHASETALKERLAKRGSRKGGTGPIQFDAARLLEQQKVLEKIYTPQAGSTFDTSRPSIGETAQQIARLILLGEYTPFDFDERLNQILASKGVL